MTYTLITANRNYSSWSLRPWLLMKGLGLTFEDQLQPFTKPSNYEEFRSFSPTGQVPVLLDEGRTIHDSLGITLIAEPNHEVIRKADEESTISKPWFHFLFEPEVQHVVQEDVR